MATARNIYPDQAAIEITISPTGTITNAQGYQKIADGTPVQFNNTATFDVNLVFTSVFGTVPDASGQPSQEISASETAVNYVVKRQDNNKQTGGPYALQWGNGVLGISVTTSSGPFTIAVPPGGNVQFRSDGKYSIGWAFGSGGVTVWSPQPTEVLLTPQPPSPNPNPVQTARPGASSPVSCSFGSAQNVPGKGTVHIGS